MKQYLATFLFGIAVITGHTQTINATTYPLTTTAGAVLEDMSTGTTQFIGPSADNGASGTLQNIGFDFWYVGGRYTQYDVSANGYIRMGRQVFAPGATNDLGNNFTTSTRATTAVTIPDAMPRYPIISSSNTIKSLSAAPGSSVTVAAGINLIIFSN